MKKEFSENERGSAGVKLLIFGVVAFLVAHAAYNLIPTIYQASDIKQEVHTAVVQGSALPGTAGNPVDLTKIRIKNYVVKSGINDAVIDVQSVNGGMMKASVKYNRQIDILPLGLYKYNYAVDHTDSPAGFLMKQ